MVGRFSARVSASFSSDSTGNGRCSRDGHLGLVGVVLRRQAEHVVGAGGFQLGEQVAERAGLRRAAARAGDHVPVVDQADLAGLAGAGIGEHHGAARQRRQRSPRCRRWRRRLTGGIVMPARCAAAPSSVGAGILLQSTSSRFFWFIAYPIALSASWWGGGALPSIMSSDRDRFDTRAMRSPRHEDLYPRARIRRPSSRPQSRFFSVSRLSCSFLPLAIASSELGAAAFVEIEL